MPPQERGLTKKQRKRVITDGVVNKTLGSIYCKGRRQKRKPTNEGEGRADTKSRERVSGDKGNQGCQGIGYVCRTLKKKKKYGG